MTADNVDDLGDCRYPHGIKLDRRKEIAVKLVGGQIEEPNESRIPPA
jgi:hypothetical protein